MSEAVMPPPPERAASVRRSALNRELPSSSRRPSTPDTVATVNEDLNRRRFSARDRPKTGHF